VERGLALTDGSQVELQHLQAESEPAPKPVDLKTAVEEAERTAIQAALAHSDGAIGKAAESLGISRKNLWEKMRRHGL